MIGRWLSTAAGRLAAVLVVGIILAGGATLTSAKSDDHGRPDDPGSQGHGRQETTATTATATVTATATASATGTATVTPTATPNSTPAASTTESDGRQWHGLCNAYFRGSSNGQNHKHESTAFKALEDAAGGASNVQSFCNSLGSPTSVASPTPTGSPTPAGASAHENQGKGNGKPSGVGGGRLAFAGQKGGPH